MAVCRVGREPIEHADGFWTPSEGNTHDGPCAPAPMTTIELLTNGITIDCFHCAWPSPAMFLIGGKGCCEPHVLRAMQHETAVLEARGAIRGASIES